MKHKPDKLDKMSNMQLAAAAAATLRDPKWGPILAAACPGLMRRLRAIHPEIDKECPWLATASQSN